MRFILTIMTFLILLVSSVPADDDGGTASPFGFGTGTRELAMAGSVLAESDASSSPFWNPSRLATAERFSLTGLHSRLFFPGSVYQYLGIAIPTLDQGGFGLGIFRQGIDGIEKRDDANQLLGKTQDNQLRLYLAHGRTISGYNLGLAATLEYHSLDGLAVTSSPGIDLSVGRRFLIDRWWLRKISAAINVRNVLRLGMKLADVKYQYPTELKTGLTIDLHPTPSDDHRILLSASLTKAQSTRTNLALGFEYTVMNLLSIRGGAADGKLSAGVGLQFGGIGFDYAMVERDFGSIHVVSFTTFFGRSKSARLSDRVRKREAEFNSTMNKLFTDRNIEMMEELLESGRDNLDEANYSEATSVLYRAMFLGRTNGSDTLVIIDLISRAEKGLERVQRNQQYKLYLDSAQNCAAREDHIGAKYFAGQALLIDSESIAARSIFENADQAMRESTNREKMLADKLAAVDSAMVEEKFERASLLIKSLKEFAPDNEGVMLRSSKIDYELLKLKFNDPNRYVENSSEYLQTQTGIDSTAMTQNSITDSMPEDDTGAFGIPATVSENDLSPQLRKEVDEIYNTARQYFENGQLNEAVSLWEQVDRSAPGYKSVREYLVKAYTFVGANLYAHKQREEALAVWNKVARLDPSNTEVLGYILRTKNEINKLRALLNEE
jgi:tetratricopeptide (TPR) repeat protein